MKQKGQDWITADGKTTQAKYIPKDIILHERIGQRIAFKAIILENELRKTKAYFVNLCKEAIQNTDDHNQKDRLVFFTFDREFRIEFYQKEENVRIYRATVANPGHRDYEAVLLDLNRIDKPHGRPAAEEEDLIPPPPDLFVHDNFGNNQEPLNNK